MAREVCPACGAQVCLSCNDDVCPVCLHMADESPAATAQAPRLLVIEGGQQRASVRLVPRLVPVPPDAAADGRRWG